MPTKNINASYEKLCEYERSLNETPPAAVSQADSGFYEIKNGKLVKSSTKSKSKNSDDISTKRVRCFRLVSYIPVPQLESFLQDGFREGGWIHHWAYCLHDKDSVKDSEGNISIKRAHTHILLYTYNPKSSRAMSKIFDRYALSLCDDGEMLEKTLCQPCDDIVRWWRYLIHADETDPLYWHYRSDERVTDNDKYWRGLERSQALTDVSENKAHAMVEDYIQGATYREMISRYGHYFLQNVNRIRDIANHICIEEGRPIPHVNGGAGDKLGYDILELILGSSHFNPTELNNFRVVFAYLQTQCFASYGTAVDLYLTERN